MEAEAIFARLKVLAPGIAFTMSRKQDPHPRRWNGGGNDPRRSGFVCCDVMVKAQMIVEGEKVKGMASLGDSYYKPDEPVINDMHGYLPQKLEEAIEELQTQIEDEEALKQIAAVLNFLHDEIHERYEKEQRDRRQHTGSKY